MNRSIKRTSMKRERRASRLHVGGWVMGASIALASTGLAQAQPKDAPKDAPKEAPVDDAKKAEAKAHFETGLKQYNAQAYDSALAEFKQSLALFPTRAALKNAGLTLRMLKRFDEAADTFDKLLTDYPDLSPEDRTVVENEKKELVALVGTLDVRVVEPDATVLVDGVERGKTPLAKPIRVSAGSRFVRVIKEGYVPFESRVDVAGRTNVVVNAKLGALTQGGRLRVTAEDTGTPVEVLVDNVVVGKAPWEGTLPIGRHVVALRGEGNLGSPPAAVDVQLNQLAKLSLVAEPLACELRIEPTPITAKVAVDGVDVGQGTWEGKLRCGGHQVELSADDHLPVRRQVSITEGKPGKVTEILERDPNSEAFRKKNPPRITVDVRVGPALSPNISGRHTSGCENAECSSGIGAGVLAQARVGYQLGMGLGFAFDAGFLYLTQSTQNRASYVEAFGLGQQKGLANDTQFMRGPLLGGSVSVQRGEKLAFMGRLGAGVYVGIWKETRAGSYKAQEGTPNEFGYNVPQDQVTSMSGVAIAPYVNPEVRLGYRINKTWIVDAGVQAFLLFGMQTARWTDTRAYTPCTRLQNPSCPGEVRIPNEQLLAPTIFAFVPFVGGRAEF